jgi:hypothetical protein
MYYINNKKKGDLNMDKEVKTTMLKCGVFGGVVCGLSVVLAIVISNIKSYMFIDVLFLEGIILAVIGALSCVGASSTGLFFRTERSTNVQFTNTDNKGQTKYERDRDLIKKVLPLSMLKIALIIGGVLDCILTFVV